MQQLHCAGPLSFQLQEQVHKVMWIWSPYLETVKVLYTTMAPTTGTAVSFTKAGTHQLKSWVMRLNFQVSQ